MNKKVITLLIIIFIITQAIGLFVAKDLIKHEVKATFVTDNPEDVENAVGLIVYIIVFTAILLVALAFFKSGKILWLLESLAVFGTTVIVTESILPGFAILAGFLLIMLRTTFRENIWIKNIASIIATAGAGALIGVSLGIMPIIAFMILLAVYDIIAVFGTKHMLTLAKNITEKNVAFTFSIPSKEHVFQLGTGDMVIPLVFAVSLMNFYSMQGILFPFYFIPAVIVLIASLIGLIWTIGFAEKRKIALPALPPQTVLMIIAFILIKLFFG